MKYDAKGFVDKNRDLLSATLSKLFLENCDSPLTKSFFEEGEEGGEGEGEEDGDFCGQRPGGSSSMPKKKKTLASDFKAQLSRLTAALAKTSPHFIRCIKSNASKVPKTFDKRLCLAQLRYSGLFDVVRARRAGYACRLDFEVFAQRYSAIAKVDRREMARTQCEQILRDPKVRDLDVVVGRRSRVFLKNSDCLLKFDDLRDEALSKTILKIQALARAFLQKKSILSIVGEVSGRGCPLVSAERSLLLPQEKEAEERRRALLVLERFARTLRRTLESLRSLAAASEEKSLDAALVPFFGSAPSKPSRANLLTAFANLRQAKTAFAEEDLELLAAVPVVLASRVCRAANLLRKLRARSSVARRIELEAESPDRLQSLLTIAKRLGLDDDARVQAARRRCADLVLGAEIRTKYLTPFLRNPFAHDVATIEDRLDAARQFGLASDPIVLEATATYARLEPTLRQRYRLRRAVEEVDRRALDAALSEDNDSTWPETIAALALRRMLDLEHDFFGSHDDKKDGLRLNDQLVKLCRRFEDAKTHEDRTYAEAALRHALGGGATEFEQGQKIRRVYKWRTLFCSWLQPRDDGALQNNNYRGIDSVRIFLHRESIFS